MTYRLVLDLADNYIAYQLDRSSYLNMRMFFIQPSTTSNTTEGREEATSDLLSVLRLRRFS